MTEARDLAVRSPRTDVSKLDAELMRHLEAHLADEDKLLDEYRELAASNDPPVSYIATLILEDEQRHHRVLTEMLNHIRTSAWSIEQEPHVPWLTRSADPSALRKQVKRLQGHERRDLRELRKLKRRLGSLRTTSLHGALVDALERDTRKHLHYLRVLARLARGRDRA
jgi:hypothetical protein